MTVVAHFEIERVGTIAADGSVVGDLPAFARDREELLALYRAMHLTRAFDAKAIALQRTGRLGTYASSLGEEAIGVGLASAMRAGDVLLPSFREHAAQLVRGVRLEELFLYWGGDERGSDFAGPRRDFPVSIPVGSHAAHAAGVALACKLRNEGDAAVAVFGDGATSKGDVYEAMNVAGAWQLPVVFVACNNEWAISVPRAVQSAAETLAQKAIAAGFRGLQVDGNDVVAVRAAVESALAVVREGGGPTLIEALTYRLGDHTTADDASRYRDDAEVSPHWQAEPLQRLRAYLTAEHGWSKEAEQSLLEECREQVDEAAAAYLDTVAEPPTAMFDHLYATLPEALEGQRRAVQSPGAAVVPAEPHRAPLAPPAGDGPSITLVEAVNAALARAMEEDASVVVLGEDVGADGGVFRATEHLLERFHADRVRDTPLSEALLGGLPVGLAAMGFRPVAEIQFMGFIYPVLDQLLNHAARLRNRTRGRLSCPLVLRAPFGGGIGAPEHHSESTEALFTHVPGLRVVVPSSPARAYGLLLAAIRDPDPVVFLEPKRSYRSLREPVVDDGRALPLDRAFVLRAGTDLTLISWGAMLTETLAAAETLAADGIEAEVIDVATLKPLDTGTILSSVAKTGRAVIVHEAALTSGFGAEIAARLAGEGLMSLLAPVERVAGWDTVMPLPRLEKAYLPTAARVVAACRRVLEYR